MEGTEVHLEVGESRVRRFEKKRPISAIIELIWNGLDADATTVAVELRRTITEAIHEIVVVDNGEGMLPEQARLFFREFGETWKAQQEFTTSKRLLHGENGEGRLFAFALGVRLEWITVGEHEDGTRQRTRITGNANRPTVWSIVDEGHTEQDTGTTVRIEVPQGKKLGTLENAGAYPQVLAALAPHLRTYPELQVSYDGKSLNVVDIENSAVELPVDADEYDKDTPPPVVIFIEWNRRVPNKGMLITGSDGKTRGRFGEPWGESVVFFTAFLKSARFNDLSLQDLHELPMRHSSMLLAAEQAIRRHLTQRRKTIAGDVVSRLKEEGLYPYDLTIDAPVDVVERRTFDLVVTVARTALPSKREERQLSVGLIQSALEQDPSTLQTLLRKALTLTPAEEEHLVRLLEYTELSNIIAAASTVTDRLNFVGGLRKILADSSLRANFREVDQLHPLVSRNLWLFGEEWSLTRSEVNLTTVLEAHLNLLGEDVVVETNLGKVKREDGRDGRVDVLLFRSSGDDRFTERLVVELKRPTVRVGRQELQQIISYARALVGDPQFIAANCRWQFLLVTYEYHPEIERDLNQQNKPRGLADDQEEYQVWVKTWGELFDAAERKLRFFRDQLDYDASESRVTSYLQTTYNEYLPEGLKELEPSTEEH